MQILKQFNTYLKYKNYEFHFIKPYTFKIKKDKKNFVCEDENFDIHIIASSEEDLYNQLSEEFVFLWKEYALEDDINLINDAIKLKNRVLNTFTLNKIKV